MLKYFYQNISFCITSDVNTIVMVVTAPTTTSNIVGVVNLVEANASGTTGLLILVQSGTSSEVSIRGRISALSAGTHGFHVHTTGSTANNCADAGGHFNPFNVSLIENVVDASTFALFYIL